MHIVDANRESCRFGKTTCPFPVICKEEEGMDCPHWSCKPRLIPTTLTEHGVRDCCKTAPGSEHRIQCPHSTHRHATWRDREPHPADSIHFALSA